MKPLGTGTWACWGWDSPCNSLCNCQIVQGTLCILLWLLLPYFLVTKSGTWGVLGLTVFLTFHPTCFVSFCPYCKIQMQHAYQRWVAGNVLWLSEYTSTTGSVGSDEKSVKNWTGECFLPPWIPLTGLPITSEEGDEVFVDEIICSIFGVLKKERRKRMSIHQNLTSPLLSPWGQLTAVCLFSCCHWNGCPQPLTLLESITSAFMRKRVVAYPTAPNKLASVKRVTGHGLVPPKSFPESNLQHKDA